MRRLKGPAFGTLPPAFLRENGRSVCLVVRVIHDLAGNSINEYATAETQVALTPYLFTLITV